MTKKEGRVFSGARPTGRQHLGNYLGAIKNYVALQDEYEETIYCIVDIHALTTIDTTENLKQNTYEMALDWLAAGLRPDDSMIFVQSHIPEVLELHAFLSMVTPLGKLTDLPTFKEKARHQPHNINYGLVGYPVLMAADITLYKAVAVTREIVRSFNYRYGSQVLIEPQMRATKIPKVLGIDGKNKMSKSLNNHIELAATPKETEERVRQMVTDPQRIRRADPGNPDICNVFTMHKVFSSKNEIETINVECRKAGIGCVDCKKRFAKNLNANLEPFRAKRAKLDANPDQVWGVLRDGADRARVIAKETIKEVKEAIGLP
jgi:tryptophanyl-tRNA synthetase